METQRHASAVGSTKVPSATEIRAALRPARMTPLSDKEVPLKDTFFFVSQQPIDLSVDIDQHVRNIISFTFVRYLSRISLLADL